MKLYKHQQDIIDADPKKCGLFLGTGSGKTRIALMLARGRTLVICPKTQYEDKNWEREFYNGGISLGGEGTLTTISKETFRRDHATLGHFDTVIVDEAHTCLGVTPNTRQRNRVVIPRASQLYEALESFLRRVEPERVYLCTATIMRSPMTVWGAAQVLRMEHVVGDFYGFRSRFYVKLPMPGREVWAPKSDTGAKSELAAIVRLVGYVGRLEDYFDVPPQTFKTDWVELTAEQKKKVRELRMEYPDPIVRIGKTHQVENGVLVGNEFDDGKTFSNGKIERILEYAAEFDRMVVFAKYRRQIEEIERALIHNGYKVWIMTGDTKDRGAVLAEVNAASRCVFVVQSQISMGWELPTYPVMVFASRTYSLVDYDQGVGRILRANALKKNLYINLVVRGGVDEAVDKSLRNKQDFNERLYAGI